jgi:hypothetical protein
MGAWSIWATILRSTCQDARALRAGAHIAVLGGLRAERKASVATIVDELRDVQRGLEEVASKLREAAVQEDLPDDEKDKLRGRLFETDPAKLIYVVLGLNKLIEHEQCGRVYEWARIQTIALMVAFARFAPEAFGEALETWDGDGAPNLSVIEGGING